MKAVFNMSSVRLYEAAIVLIFTKIPSQHLEHLETFSPLLKSARSHILSAVNVSANRSDVRG